MATSHGLEKPKILLDWFTIRYRTLVTIIFAVLLLGGVGAYYAYVKFFYEGSPKADAREAINHAEETLSRADPVMELESANELKRTAQRLLAEARRQYDAANYQDARKAAVESNLNSEKAISMSRGESSREVQLYKVEGDVKVKRARELIWMQAEQGFALSVGDQIKTSSRSSAQIIYFNGTITTIRPGSLLEIKALYDDPATKIQQVRERLREGRIAASTQEGVEGSYHEVSTQNSVATSSNRSDFEVSFDKEGSTTKVEVHAGEATLSAGSAARKVKIGAYETASVNAKAVVTEITKIVPAPVPSMPPDQKIFLSKGGQTPSVELAWDEVQGASRYRLQISSQPLFASPEVDLPAVQTTTATLPNVQEGGYYWRVSAVMGDGRVSLFSTPRRFKVMSAQVAQHGDVAPPALRVDDFLVFASQVIIRGHTEPGALLTVEGHKVDVYDDGSFTTVVPLRRAGVNHVIFVAQDMAGNESRLDRTAHVDAY